MISRPDIILGTDTTFSEDPSVRKTQVVDTVLEGFTRMSRRFGSLRRTNWAPTPYTTIFCETTDELITHALRSGNDYDANRLEEFASAHAVSNMKTGITAFNMPVIRNPADLMFTSAHETVHQWAGDYSIGLPNTKLQVALSAGSEKAEFITEMEKDADEAMTDYVACEGLSIIDTRVDFGPGLGGKNLVRDAAMIRQSLMYWGEQRADYAFMLLQGTLPAECITELNREMGEMPGQLMSTDYLEHGVLATAAVLHHGRRVEFDDVSPLMYRNTLSWLQARFGTNEETRELYIR